MTYSQYFQKSQSLPHDLPQSDSIIYQTGQQAILVGLAFTIWSGIWQKWHLALLTLTLTLALLVFTSALTTFHAPKARALLFIFLLLLIALGDSLCLQTIDWHFLAFLLILYPLAAFNKNRQGMLASICAIALYLLARPMWSSLLPPLLPVAAVSAYFNVGLQLLAAGVLVFNGQRFLKHNKEWQEKLENDQHRYKDLIRVACHDLSNPLTLIIGSAQIAQTESFRHQPEKSQIFWHKVEKAAFGMNKIVANMRAYEALQHPKRIIAREISLVPQLEEICFSLQEKLTRHKIRLQTKLAIDRELKVYIDPHFFSINCLKLVLNNAISYSKEGDTIFLTAELKEKNLAISIKDQGPGINPATQLQLFSFAFMREKPHDLGGKGAGFSLSIARLILQELGGTLEVISRQRKSDEEDEPSGTLVTMTLPLTKPAHVQSELLG